MTSPFERTAELIGKSNFAKLESADILVVGLGGVGGAALEVLARSGIGRFTVADGDTFEPTNLNRQLLCTRDEIGKSKADAAKRRVLSVNPQAVVTAINEFITADNVDKTVDRRFTYCVDAIDDIESKVALIAECKRKNIPIVSAMGAGNRTQCDFAVADVFSTKDDPLARKLRRLLRKAGVTELDVVCGISPPAIKRGAPLSVAAPPIVMGAMLANRVINKILDTE